MAAIKKGAPAQRLRAPQLPAMFLTIPTLLTWARIFLIPLIVGMFYLPLPAHVSNGLAAGLFVLCAFTDWLDGFLARRLGQTSAFGAFLDPVADKFLVCACVLTLVHLQRAGIFVALIIIGREIAISALREWMARIGASKSVAVHMVGKVKTGVQMVAIALLLFDGTIWQIDTRWWGTALLWAAAALTIGSMAYYLRQSVPEIRSRVS